MIPFTRSPIFSAISSWKFSIFQIKSQRHPYKYNCYHFTVRWEWSLKMDERTADDSQPKTQSKSSRSRSVTVSSRETPSCPEHSREQHMLNITLTNSQLYPKQLLQNIKLLCSLNTYLHIKCSVTLCYLVLPCAIFRCDNKHRPNYAPRMSPPALLALILYPVIKLQRARWISSDSPLPQCRLAGLSASVPLAPGCLWPPRCSWSSGCRRTCRCVAGVLLSSDLKQWVGGVQTLKYWHPSPV